MSETWVVVGAEVVERQSSFTGEIYGRPRKIAKVYASGNFVLEGSKDQWRPGRDGARRTGEHGYHSRYVIPLTDENRAEIAKNHAVSVARNRVAAEAKRLDGLSRSRDGDAILAEASRIPEPASTQP